MDENPTTQTDAPVRETAETPQPNEPTLTTDQVSQEPASTTETAEEATVASPEPAVVQEEEEEQQTFQQVPAVAPIDFSQLQADENGLIDPNALAGAINQRIAQAEQNASARAQQIYAEQEQEKRLWDKAYEKYPDLKTDKELNSLVQQARIGEATDLLSRSNDPASVKLPTPGQVADKLFKRIGTAKTEGMQQATTNTVVQKSAQLETASRKSDDGAETVQQARANLNNPNKEVANKARNELLRKYLGWE